MPTVLHFNGSAEYADWISKQSLDRHYLYHNKRQVASNVSASEADIDHGINLLTTGDTSSVDQINALMEQLEVEVAIPHKIQTPAVYGHRVNMGGYLSGSPLTMYRRKHEPSNHEPIKIYINTVSSIGIDADTINKRGAALAAFALALGAHRTVYLTPFTFSADHRGKLTNGCVLSCDIATSPIVLSEVAAHTSVYVARYANCLACHSTDPLTDWSHTLPTAHDTELKQILNVQPDDIFLGALHLRDPLVSNPVQWIKDTLQKYTSDDDN